MVEYNQLQYLMVILKLLEQVIQVGLIHIVDTRDQMYLQLGLLQVKFQV